MENFVTRRDRAASPWPAPEARARERQMKRDAVLATAVRFFNLKGFTATSLDDVALALNVTKPTIYHYFASKDEILAECLRRGLEAIRAAALEAGRGGGNGAARLRAMLIAYATIMTRDFGICVGRTNDNELSPESRAPYRATKREIDGILRAAIAEGIADGSLRPQDVRMAGFTAAGALNSIARWFDPEGPMPAAAVAEAVVDTLMGGLAAGRE